MTRLKICVVTGTRADYGLLSPLLKMIQNDASLELQLIVTGMHLSPEFGYTVLEIEQDGFPIAEKVEMLLSSDSAGGITKSVGLGTIQFANSYSRIKPDYVLLFGDRFEMYAAAQSALFAQIPMGHIAGGDSTEGAFDEALRHGMTKMAHLHFPTNYYSAARIIQLGENPEQVFNVGHLGIDAIRATEKMDKVAIEDRLSFKFREKNVLVTFHPATLDLQSPLDQFQNLLKALDRLGSDVGIIITKPNADTDGRGLITMIDKYAQERTNVISHVSLGHRLYVNTMSFVDAVIGNSSSGIYEAPYFRKPTVNIGDRQKGRVMANSVFCCNTEEEQIYKAIQEALAIKSFDIIDNPYGDGNAAGQIVDILKMFAPGRKLLLKKRFHDLVGDQGNDKPQAGLYYSRSGRKS